MLIKDIASIKISGRCFNNESVLSFFPNDGHRLCFVFGGNGSGKSTISNAFALKCNSTLPSGVTEFSLLDSAGSVVADENRVLAATHVFNEEFVEEKVRVSSNGLGSIVMLGEAGELADKIDKAKNEKADLIRKLEKNESDVKALDDSSDPRSPGYYDNAITESLSGSGRWNDRERCVRSLQRSASVTANVISDIEQQALPTSSKEEIDHDLEAGLKKLSDLSEGESLPSVPSVPDEMKQFDESTIVELLAKEIQKPILSDREKRLLEIAQQVGTRRLSEARDYFSKGNVTYCPYCFRDISTDEINSFADSVSLVLNEGAEEHSAELKNLRFPQLEIGLEHFARLDKALVSECKQLIDKANEILRKYEMYTQEKIDNLYTPKKIESLGVIEVVSRLESKLTKLESLRIQWNKEIEGKNSLVEDLQRLNKQLARFEIDALIKKRIEAKKQKEIIVEEAADLTRQHSEKLEQIANYEAQKSNIKIALDEINSALAFIFLDKKHLVLEGTGGEYRLLSHGASVKPCDISTGERNAIALCYFFTLIGEGKSVDEAFSDEMLLIVDDPISSFDQENRIGMLSYLRQQFKLVLKSNAYSKIICFTHDGYSMNVFAKMGKEIRISIQKALPNKAFKEPGRFALADGALSEWTLVGMRYGEMLKEMYDYSLNPSEQLRPFIGNVSRRALEAFSTFEFALGISEFADSSIVLERIPSDALKAYFGNLMFHMVLHGESHTADPVYTEGLVETLPEYTSDTVDRMVRDTLCLIYSINKGHLLTHLQVSEGVETNIVSWTAEIESTMSRQ